MCTIIKVKRKIDENPVDQLVIECKKQKIILPDQENVNEESIKQIFKYFGTAQTENDIPEKLNEINRKLKTKEDLQDGYKSVLKKERKPKSALVEQAKVETKSQRYVLLSKKRDIHADNPDMNIINVISSTCSLNEQNVNQPKKSPSRQTDEISCNEKPLIKEKKIDFEDSNYIYDIYFNRSDPIDYLDIFNANNYTISSYTNDLFIFDNEKDDVDDERQNNDDEDSNAEEYWMNDYPDEDDEYDYNDYADPSFDYVLSGVMKKSCQIADMEDNDSDDEDFTEYCSDSKKSRSYNAYKKSVLKEFYGDDHDDDDNDYDDSADEID